MSKPKAQCRHIKANGEQCGNNAIAGRRVCYIASHCGSAPRLTRAWNYIQNHPVKTIIGIVFAVVVAIPALYGYATRITVAPGPSIRSHEPMGTVFNVTNNGVFTLSDATHQCHLIRVTDPHGVLFSDDTFSNPGFRLGDLAPGETKSLSCENVIAGLHGEAALEIRIIYHRWPMPHHSFTKSFSFESIQADDGTWIWKAR